MVKTNKLGSVRVNKTISMDLELLQTVIDESMEMNKDFSATMSVLVRIGLAVREQQRIRDKQVISDMARSV